MDAKIKCYLEALQDGDFETLMTLFTKKAKVVSPLYGVQKANVFYRDLFRDTNRSKIKLLGIFTNLEDNTASVNFIYEWTLANGRLTTFDCVDIFHFNKKNKITQLKIIYDTQQTRPLFNEVNKGQ